MTIKKLVVFVFALQPMVASAEAVEIGGIYYNLVDKIKTAEVTSNPNGYLGDVTIPSSVVYADKTFCVTSFRIIEKKCN